MGYIFGISNLPVSTIMTPFEPIVPVPEIKNIIYKRPVMNYVYDGDKFVSKPAANKSNPFIKMRNGFGKLMKHYSRKAVK